MRTVAALVASLAMALAALGIAVAAPGDGGERARVELLAASGAVRIANSREGHAVFNAAGMRPGEGVSGTVRIGNDGDVRGRFSVRPAGLRDVPGPGGGTLSGHVQMVLFDVTDVQRPLTVYAGPVAAFGAVAVGDIAPGAHRDFLVAATLPASGDNRLQGAGMSLGFEWRAAAVPVATPAPTATPAPAPAVPPVAPAPTAATPGDALGLPSTRSCVKRPRLRVRLRVPGGASVESATIAVNRKVRARVTGGRTTVRVKLRGVTRRFKVRVTIVASDGNRYTSTRRYRLCKRR
jgi:spore coat-associated protein N